MYKEKKEYEEKRFPIDKNHGKDKEDCKKHDWDEHEIMIKTMSMIKIMTKKIV